MEGDPCSESPKGFARQGCVCGPGRPLRALLCEGGRTAPSASKMIIVFVVVVIAFSVVVIVVVVAVVVVFVFFTSLLLSLS